MSSAREETEYITIGVNARLFVQLRYNTTLWAVRCVQSYVYFCQRSFDFCGSVVKFKIWILDSSGKLYLKWFFIIINPNLLVVNKRFVCRIGWLAATLFAENNGIIFWSKIEIMKFGRLIYLTLYFSSLTFPRNSA